MVGHGDGSPAHSHQPIARVGRDRSRNGRAEGASRGRGEPCSDAERLHPGGVAVGRRGLRRRTQLFIGSVSQNILIMNGLILTPQNLSPMEQYQRALNDLGLHRPPVGVQTSSKPWVWAGAAVLVLLVAVSAFVWARRRASSEGGIRAAVPQCHFGRESVRDGATSTRPRQFRLSHSIERFGRLATGLAG